MVGPVGPLLKLQPVAPHWPATDTAQLMVAKGSDKCGMQNIDVEWSYG